VTRSEDPSTRHIQNCKPCKALLLTYDLAP
jgi:hypothetical protein